MARTRVGTNRDYKIQDGSLVTTYAPNIVVNGDMELDSNWTDWNLEVGDVNERSDTRAKEGTYSRHIVVDATGEGATSDNVDVTIGKTYRVSCWVWVVSGVAQFRRNAARIDFTFSSSTTGEWEYLSEDVECTETGAEKFRLEASEASEYYVDEVKIEELNFVEEEIGGFEDITGFTVTGTGALITADTTNFKEGTQGLKTTSVNAASAYATTPADKFYDFSTANRFSLWLYIDDLTKMFQSGVGLVYFYTGAADYYIYSVTASRLRTGWNRISFAKSDCTENNSPDWNLPITQIKFRALSLSGQTVNLTVDDFRVDRYEKPKVVISFDDGNATDYSEAFSYMQPLGLKGTCFVYKDGIGAGNQLTLAQCQEMYVAGWDIGNHSSDGQDLTSVTTSVAAANVTECADWLINNGMPRAAWMLAWPHSALNSATMEAIRDAGIIVARQGVNDTNPHETQEKLNLNRGSVANTNSVADLTAYIDTIIERGGVLIYNFHDIEDPADDSTDVLPATFQSVMDYIKPLHDGGIIDVVTISEWYNGLDGRRTTSGTRTAAGTRTTAGTRTSV
jgi:peptidoglycan/xylan/chitin deacetylase (PgdA/CDA1 family)